MKNTKGSLEYLHISNKVAEAKVTLQGAHLFHFQVKGQAPLLWVSESASFEEGKAIRGGIPVCWPWFGPHPTDSTLPNHGFARTSMWTHIKTEEVSENETKVILGLNSSQESLQLWPYRFELRLEINIGAELMVSLVTKNLDTKTFTISDALHTYLAIEDINTVYIDGLDKKNYYDKKEDSFENIQDGRLYFTQETDRIYQGITSTLSIHESNRCIHVNTEGSQTVVIWNPGEALAQTMPDLSDHKKMLCVESANTLDDVPLIEPNESHRLTTVISID
jgi:glucose-6-phosphate 1-epimerase